MHCTGKGGRVKRMRMGIRDSDDGVNNKGIKRKRKKDTQ
jgi:hypothetical protein